MISNVEVGISLPVVMPFPVDIGFDSTWIVYIHS